MGNQKKFSNDPRPQENEAPPHALPNLNSNQPSNLLYFSSNGFTSSSSAGCIFSWTEVPKENSKREIG